MDLLETVLRTCCAENYLTNFRTNGIDSYTLKILNEEDLLLLGVLDAEVRENILAHTANLQIPGEKKINTTVDKEYLLRILSQISVQINKHYANLTYTLKRTNTDLCPIKVMPALNCLQDCLKSLDSELSIIESKFTKGKKKKRSPYVLVMTVAVTSAFLFGFVKYIKS